MALNRLLFPILIQLILLVSCQKDVTFVWGPELPEEEVIVCPDSSKKQLKLAVIGDSISSFKDSSPSDLNGYNGAKYATYYPIGDVKHIANMWWYKVAQSLNVSTDDICNCSWSGSRITGDSSSTTSASAGCSTKRIMDLSIKGFSPDIVFCFISCNDWAGNIPLGNWSDTDDIPAEGVISTSREAYALMISKIKQYYPSCRIVYLTNLDDTKRDYTPGWPSNNRRGVSVDDWNKSLGELAKALGCYIIDLQDCGINYFNVSTYTVDGGLHPNDAGMTLIANKIIKELTAIMEMDDLNTD